MHRRIHRSLSLLVPLVLALAPAITHAEPTAADKETARALLLDGRTKLAAKDHEGALRSFRAAHAIMGVPTTGLDLARGLEAMGQLIEARAMAIDVTRIPVNPGEPKAFADARAAAAQFAESLGARIPAVIITVKGAEGAAPTVTLDGAPLPPALLGLPRKLNPGLHVIAASAPGFVAEPQRVGVPEGASVPVEILLTRPGAVAPRPPPLSVKPALPVPATVFPVPRKATPAWVWIAGGAGLAALGGSVAFAVDYAKVRSTLASDCPSNTCDPSKVGMGQQAHDHMQALRGRWNHDLGLTIGLGAAGFAGIGAAVTGIAKVPRDERRASRATLVPLLEPGAIGGVFVGGF